MRTKNLGTKKTRATGAIASAVEAIVDAITPKPIRAGDKLIIPSADASMPPVIVPVRKRARRTTSRKPAARGRTTARKARSSVSGKSAK
jgi:hypothetical protein